MEYLERLNIKIKNYTKILPFVLIIFSSIIIFSSTNRLENYENIENWPVLGYNQITSDYGYRISPITGNKSFHSGIDIGVPEGGKILAVIDSEVKFVGYIYGYGCTIILYSEDIEIIYSHISPKYIVTQGMKIKRGDCIGYGGPKYIKLNGSIITNGYTTGPHLHFEVRKNNIIIDPINYLNSLENANIDNINNN